MTISPEKQMLLLESCRYSRQTATHLKMRAHEVRKRVQAEVALSVRLQDNAKQIRYAHLLMQHWRDFERQRRNQISSVFLPLPEWHPQCEENLSSSMAESLDMEAIAS